MQQFASLNILGKVGAILPLRGQGTQIVTYVNILDNQGNFLKTEKLYINLFNSAQSAVLKRNVVKGDYILIQNGKYNSYLQPDGSTLVTVVCNFANQVAIFANENHEILEQRMPGALA